MWKTNRFACDACGHNSFKYYETNLIVTSPVSEDLIIDFSNEEVDGDPERRVLYCTNCGKEWEDPEVNYTDNNEPTIIEIYDEDGNTIWKREKTA